MNPCSNEPPDSKKCAKIKPLPTPPPKKNTNKQNKNKNKQNTQVVAIEVSSPDRHSHRIWSPAIQIRLKGGGGGGGRGRGEKWWKIILGLFHIQPGICTQTTTVTSHYAYIVGSHFEDVPSIQRLADRQVQMSSLSVVHNNHSRSFTYSFPMAT